MKKLLLLSLVGTSAVFGGDDKLSTYIQNRFSGFENDSIVKVLQGQIDGRQKQISNTPKIEKNKKRIKRYNSNITFLSSVLDQVNKKNNDAARNLEDKTLAQNVQQIYDNVLLLQDLKETENDMVSSELSKQNLQKKSKKLTFSDQLKQVKEYKVEVQQEQVQEMQRIRDLVARKGAVVQRLQDELVDNAEQKPQVQQQQPQVQQEQDKYSQRFAGLNHFNEYDIRDCLEKNLKNKLQTKPMSLKKALFGDALIGLTAYSLYQASGPISDLFSQLTAAVWNKMPSRPQFTFTRPQFFGFGSGINLGLFTNKAQSTFVGASSYASHLFGNLSK